MKNKTLALGLAASMLLIATPLLAAEVPAFDCKAPTKVSSEADWNSYYGCYDAHIQAHRKAIDNHNKAIDEAIAQMRKERGFQGK